MTSTANNTQPQPATEVPLIWTSGKVRGSEGLTHRSTAEINGETWKFTVDQPTKGHWRTRAWRDGDFELYREGKTMKGAKGQAQAYANYAATSTCTECKRIGGHTLACTLWAAESLAKDVTRGTKIGLRAEVTDVQDSAVVQLRDEGAEVAEVPEQRTAEAGQELGPEILGQLEPQQAQQLMAELEATFPHLAEWKRDTLGATVKPAGQQLGPVAGATAFGTDLTVVSAAESMSRMAAAVERVQAARDRVQLRKATCGCRTPLHTMRCGAGGRARVISSAVSL